MTTKKKAGRGGAPADVRASQVGVVLRGNMTKLKMLLPVGKPRAWKLIATPEGLSSWFPAACHGQVAVGESLAFEWPDGSVERFRVRRLGDKRSSMAVSWRRGAEWRIYLHGRRTTLTLEVEYRPGVQGRRERLRELPIWVFRLANLKSVAIGGRDLRRSDAGATRSPLHGFIDGLDRGP